jgi:hypothetical protein
MAGKVESVRLIRGFDLKEMGLIRDALDIAQAYYFNVSSNTSGAMSEENENKGYKIGEIISQIKDKELIIAERMS